MDGLLKIIITWGCFGLCLYAQQTVPSTQGSSNAVPKFSDGGTLVDSTITDANHIVSVGSPERGAVAIAPDDSDSAQSYMGAIGETGPSTHLRVTRPYCDQRSESTQSASDQENFFCVPDAVTIDDTHPPSSTPNKDFIIAPYRYGMGMEYPGLIEVFSSEFSVHTNWFGCPNCDTGAHLWVGDVDDRGGILATAYDVVPSGSTTIDRSQSFVSIASQTFTGTSHGDMLFAVRDPEDSFRFQFGPNLQAEAPGIYPQFTKARIDSTGKGFFDGGTQTGGADFAESVGTALATETYEPGDVLVIDTTSDRRVSLASSPYSTLVAGIYSTKPGVIATPHNAGDPVLKGEIPMAVVGIVPCKVSTENGPIVRGDLLVTSSTPGYAMRATDKSRILGALVGKALQPWADGRGKIEVLIALQ